MWYSVTSNDYIYNYVVQCHVEGLQIYVVQCHVE